MVAAANQPAPEKPGKTNHSTGPRTPEGKARSSMNALKHGLTAKVPLLPGEDEGEFRTFVWSMIEDLGAEGPAQLELAHRAAVLMWKQRRIHAAEDQAFDDLRREYAEESADKLEEKEEFAETPEDFKKLEEAKADEKEYGAIWDAREMLADQFALKADAALARLARYEQRLSQQIDSTIRLLLKLQNRKDWRQRREQRQASDPDAVVARPVPRPAQQDGAPASPPPPFPQNELPAKPPAASGGNPAGTWRGPPGSN